MAVAVGNGVGCGTVVGGSSTMVGVAANGLAGKAGRLSQAAPRSGSTSMMKHADHRFILSAPKVGARRANSLPDCTGESIRPAAPISCRAHQQRDTYQHRVT